MVTAPGPAERLPRTLLLGAGAVVLLALAVRLLLLLRGAAVSGGTNGYDQAVYYAAGDALLHGRTPYHDGFAFIHPPGVALVTVPFALVGDLTAAHTGFMLANAGFAAMGALTAGLVVLVARRGGAPPAACLAGGVLYATWTVVATSQASARLEPLGDLLLALALVLVGPGADPTRRRLLLAGVVAGLLLNVKLWWVAPAAVVFLVGVVPRAGVRRALLVPAAAAATCVVVDLPFLLLSRGHMVADVVSSQLGRPAVQGLPSGEYGRLPTLVRLTRMTGAEPVAGRLGVLVTSPAVVLGAAVVGALVVLACLCALRTPLGRVMVAVLVVQVLVLLATPIFFPYYGDFVGLPLALVVAASATRAPRGDREHREHREHRRVPTVGRVPTVLLPAAAVAGVLALLTVPRDPALLHLPDRVRLAAATADLPCVVADSPRVLIEVDALDRSFAPGCRDVVDLQAVGYGAGGDPQAEVVVPRSNRAWKRYVVDYLRSGDAVALGDPYVRALLGPAAYSRVARGAVVVRSEGIVVRRTGATAGGTAR